MISTRIELVTSLSELVGYKAGIALSRERMARLADDDDFFLGDGSTLIRIRSEVFEEILCKLLYAVGNISSSNSMPSYFDVHRRFAGTKVFGTLIDVHNFFIKFIENHTEQGPVDLNRFVEQVQRTLGDEHGAMALVIADCLVADQHKSSLTAYRRFNWADAADLDSLFKSEKLDTPHGNFLDQRFIDYLSHNFNQIDEIHWRKFEGLVCAFFHKLGFRVEIGRGRNDDSIDARVWDDSGPGEKPHLILVQCKRETEDR